MLPYQLRYIYDTSRWIAVEKSVRIGMTYAHSYKWAKRLTFSDPNRQQREIFASKNRVTAGEYLNYHRKWAEAFNTFVPGLVDLSRWTTEIARYPCGEILIVSSEPNSFRGLGGSPTFDEFSFHMQQDELYAAGQSRLMHVPDGQMTLISSHSHPETTFARVCNEARMKKNPFSLHSTTLPEAVAQGLALKVHGEHLKLLNPKAA